MLCIARLVRASAQPSNQAQHRHVSWKGGAIPSMKREGKSLMVLERGYREAISSIAEKDSTGGGHDGSARREHKGSHDSS